LLTLLEPEPGGALFGRPTGEEDPVVLGVEADKVDDELEESAKA